MAKSKKGTNNTELPTVLAFERKLEPSDALMFAGNWQDDDKIEEQKWIPIAIISRRNRGVKNSYAHRKNTKDLRQANPVEGDKAQLPPGNDTLKVSFNLRVLGNIGKPYASSNSNFTDKLIAKLKDYKEELRFDILAQRYAYNIVNCRFLWRNYFGLQPAKVRVKTKDFPSGILFSSDKFSHKNFIDNAQEPNLLKLAKVIQLALEGDETTSSLIDVDAYVQLGTGQQVFPSQEMNMDEKKKVLFKLSVEGNECAAMHDVKIGNAIRTIDDWYPGARCPIAVNPFGSVTQMDEVYRESKNDLYSLIKDWLDDKDVTDNDKHFVVANLIRGGVFGGKSE